MLERLHSVAILGTTGYTGQCLHALLMQHPCISPWIPSLRDPDQADPAAVAELADHAAVALALPEDAATRWGIKLREAGVPRVLDLSGAHRRVDGVHYGLPELLGAPPADAELVANPGCYPTATLLALRPLLAADLIAPRGIAVVGASGASGAGKGMQPHLQFCELHDNVFPYKVGTHRHIPEIERYLGAPISFVTELLPVVRGILVTAFVTPTVNPGALHEALQTFYAPHPYVSVLEQPGQGSGLRHVLGSHQAVLAVGPVERSGLVPVFSTIDNLMRGAASQAVANLNLWLGLEPDLGLPPPLHPQNTVPGTKALVP